MSLNRRVESDLAPHASSSLLYLRRELHADRLAFPPARGTSCMRLFIRSIWVPKSDLRFHVLVSPLPGLPPAQNCHICSSLPWWLGFVPGLRRIGVSEHDGRAVRLGRREV